MKTTLSHLIRGAGLALLIVALLLPAPRAGSAQDLPKGQEPEPAPVEVPAPPPPAPRWSDVPTTSSQPPEGGIQSLTGSYVSFDSSVGGSTCWAPGTSATFCFYAYSYSPDWEYVYNVWLKFPTNWTVTNVAVQGTPYCTSGSWGTFSWSFQTSPYEINIYHPRYHGSGGSTCYAYYCVTATPGSGSGTAYQSWYWDGDGYGGTPHWPCSNDQYTPAGQSTCDQWINPRASIPQCVPDISVNPTSLSSTQCPNTQTSQTLQICNVGGANLTWSMTEQPAKGLEALTPALSQGERETVTVPAVPAAEGEGTEAASGPFQGRPETTYTIERRPAPDAPPNVLLLHADDGSGSPMQGLLQAYGDLGTVAQYDARSATPTLAELLAYNVVLTWSNYTYSNPTAIGDVLADYVDAGGKVIDMMFGIHPSWGYLGRFRTSAYTAMTVTGATYATSCLGTYDPGHPVMSGVTNVCDYYRGNGTALTSGATAVAYWADGERFVAVKNNKTVVTINGYPGYYYQWTGQMPAVVHNAILWLTAAPDIPWLSESPTSGTVTPGNCTNVTVTFNSAGMADGTYTGNLVITNNDPDENPTTVPVTLVVSCPCPVNWPGPDGYGIVGQTTTYNWVDISTSGTPVGITGDDTVSGALPLGQAFNFYGTAYTQFYVNTNGLISFGAGYYNYYNYNLPSTSAPNNIIALAWDDLRVDSGDQIRYETKSPCPVGGGETTCTVIQFSNMYTLGGTSAGTWQAILYPGGNVILQFQSVGAANSAYSTTGIQGPVSSYPTYGMSYAYNCTGRPSAGTAIKFTYPCASVWNQPLSTVNTNAYVDQDFETAYDAYDSYLFDDFTLGGSTSICGIFVPGGLWNGTGQTLANAQYLVWSIYANSNGVPAGYPGSGLAAPLWTLSVPPTDPRVTISTGSGGLPSNVTLTLGSPIGLQAGTYWLLFYPRMDFSAGGQYGRQVADTANGNVGKFINPGGGFGYGTGWNNMTVLGMAQTDLAFQLMGYSIPTSVKLKSFTAWPEGSAIHVRWETSEEIDNLGFNLYRSARPNGEKVRLNADLIPTKVPPGSPFGAVYDWIDSTAQPGQVYYYWLEDVDLYGNTTMHGPARARLPGIGPSPGLP